MAYYRQQSLKEAFKDPDFLFGIAQSRLQNLQNVGLRMKKWRRNIGRIDMLVLDPSGAGGCGCSKAEQL